MDATLGQNAKILFNSVSGDAFAITSTNEQSSVFELSGANAQIKFNAINNSGFWVKGKSEFRLSGNGANITIGNSDGRGTHGFVHEGNANTTYTLSSTSSIRFNHALSGIAINNEAGTNTFNLSGSGANITFAGAVTGDGIKNEAGTNNFTLGGANANITFAEVKSDGISNTGGTNTFNLSGSGANITFTKSGVDGIYANNASQNTFILSGENSRIAFATLRGDAINLRNTSQTSITLNQTNSRITFTDVGGKGIHLREQTTNTFTLSGNGANITLTSTGSTGIDSLDDSNNTFNLTHTNAKIEFGSIGGNTGIYQASSNELKFIGNTNVAQSGYIHLGNITGGSKRYVIQLADQNKKISFKGVRLYYGDHSSFDTGNHRAGIYADFTASGITKDINYKVGHTMIAGENDAFDSFAGQTKFLVAQDVGGNVYGIHFKNSSNTAANIAFEKIGSEQVTEIRGLTSANNTYGIYLDGSMNLTFGEKVKIGDLRSTGSQKNINAFYVHEGSHTINVNGETLFAVDGILNGTGATTHIYRNNGSSITFKSSGSGYSATIANVASEEASPSNKAGFYNNKDGNYYLAGSTTFERVEGDGIHNKAGTSKYNVIGSLTFNSVGKSGIVSVGGTNTFNLSGSGANITFTGAITESGIKNEAGTNTFTLGGANANITFASVAQTAIHNAGTQATYSLTGANSNITLRGGEITGNAILNNADQQVVYTLGSSSATGANITINASSISLDGIKNQNAGAKFELIGGDTRVTFAGRITGSGISNSAGTNEFILSGANSKITFAETIGGSGINNEGSTQTTFNLSGNESQINFASRVGGSGIVIEGSSKMDATLGQNAKILFNSVSRDAFAITSTNGQGSVFELSGANAQIKFNAINNSGFWVTGKSEFKLSGNGANITIGNSDGRGTDGFIHEGNANTTYALSSTSSIRFNHALSGIAINNRAGTNTFNLSGSGANITFTGAITGNGINNVAGTNAFNLSGENANITFAEVKGDGISNTGGTNTFNLSGSGANITFTKSGVDGIYANNASQNTFTLSGENSRIAFATLTGDAINLRHTSQTSITLNQTNSRITFTDVGGKGIHLREQTTNTFILSGSGANITFTSVAKTAIHNAGTQATYSLTGANSHITFGAVASTGSAIINDTTKKTTFTLGDKASTGSLIFNQTSFTGDGIHNKNAGADFTLAGANSKITFAGTITGSGIKNEAGTNTFDLSGNATNIAFSKAITESGINNIAGTNTFDLSGSGANITFAGAITGNGINNVAGINAFNLSGENANITFASTGNTGIESLGSSNNTFNLTQANAKVEFGSIGGDTGIYQASSNELKFIGDTDNLKNSGYIHIGNITGGSKKYVIQLADQDKKISFKGVRLYYGDHSSFDTDNHRAGIYADFTASGINKNISYRIGDTIISTENKALNTEQTQFIIGSQSNGNVYGIYLNNSGSAANVVFERTNPSSATTIRVRDLIGNSETYGMYLNGNINLTLDNATFENLQGQKTYGICVTKDSAVSITSGLLKFDGVKGRNIFHNDGGDVRFNGGTIQNSPDAGSNKAGIYNASVGNYHFGGKTTFSRISNLGGDAYGIWDNTDVSTYSLAGQLRFEGIEARDEAVALSFLGKSSIEFGNDSSLVFEGIKGKWARGLEIASGFSLSRGAQIILDGIEGTIEGYGISGSNKVSLSEEAGLFVGLKGEGVNSYAFKIDEHNGENLSISISNSILAFDLSNPNSKLVNTPAKDLNISLSQGGRLILGASNMKKIKI
ncbi:Uncharacterised protein [Helicobacter pametensis]|nr:Uncharacterised protein [Helicobacter pametensis]